MKTPRNYSLPSEYSIRPAGDRDINELLHLAKELASPGFVSAGIAPWKGWSLGLLVVASIALVLLFPGFLTLALFGITLCSLLIFQSKTFPILSALLIELRSTAVGINLREMKKQPGNQFYVVETGNRIVALARLVREEAFSFFDFVYVTRAYRRRGIGSALVYYVVQHAERPLYLNSWANPYLHRANKQAFGRLYRSIGFVPVYRHEIPNEVASYGIYTMGIAEFWVLREKSGNLHSSSSQKS